MSRLPSLVRRSLLGSGPDGVLPDLGLLALRLGFGLTMAVTHGRAAVDQRVGQ